MPSARDFRPSRTASPASRRSASTFTWTFPRSTLGGGTAKQIHQAVLTAFQLSPKTYGLNQLRYDLRKLKGHDLLQRDGRHYAYRLTAKGLDVALLFLFFHKRLCGPLANRRFHHKPDPASRPDSKLEAAYHKADKAIENIVRLLNAA